MPEFLVITADDYHNYVDIDIVTANDMGEVHEKYDRDDAFVFVFEIDDEVREVLKKLYEKLEFVLGCVG